MPKPKQIVRSQAVLDSVSKLQRVHLGHMVYKTRVVPEDDPDVNPNHPSGRGFRTKSAPLPRFNGKENCTFTIRIPRIHLEDPSREELTAGRAVWGTDVYTDDSDVIAACIHSGWIRGAWPADVDVSLLGLDVEAKARKIHGSTGKGKENGSRRNSLANAASDKMEDVTLTDPPLLGPVSPIPDHDLQVTILILPSLEKYASTVRFGIKSREWEGTHDGLSYMILSNKWVSGVDTVNEASGPGRRQRMRLRIDEDKGEERARIEDERRWGGLLIHGNGHIGDEALTERLTQNSFERSSTIALQSLKGLGKDSWWKERPEKRKKAVGARAAANFKLGVEAERVREEQRASEEAAVNGLAGLSEAAAIESASVASGGRSLNGHSTPVPMQNEAGQWRTGSANAAPISNEPVENGSGGDRRSSRDAMIVS